MYGHAYFNLTSLNLRQLFQLQTFLFDHFSVEFMNVEQMVNDTDWDSFGNQIPEGTSFDVECLLFVSLDNNGDIHEYVPVGIANSAELGGQSAFLQLIDEEKLNNKKAELGLFDECEYDPFNRWLSKYLFFDNYKGDLDLNSREYEIAQNPSFVFEKEGDTNFIRDNRSEQEKSEAKYQLGRSHYFAKRFVEAADCFTDSAEKGDHRAQDYLGRMYHDGQGLAQNYEKALFWLEKAASQDNPDSCYDLGKIYRNGKLVKKDNKKALIFFEKAASKYNTDANVELGHHYGFGWGVQKDLKKAFDYYLKAAHAYGNDDGRANYAVAHAFALGLGVEQDAKQAFLYYQSAAKQGYAPAQDKMGDYYYYENELGLERNCEEAIHWYEKAAKQGDQSAQSQLGDLYISGECVEKNYELAFHWHQKAAEQGSLHSQANLGYMYSAGLGVEGNPTLGFQFSELAAKAGHPTAQFNLAELYRDGSSAVPKNIETALYWFSLSADQGDEESAVERDKLLKSIK